MFDEASDVGDFIIGLVVFPTAKEDAHPFESESPFCLADSFAPISESFVAGLEFSIVICLTRVAGMQCIEVPELSGGRYTNRIMINRILYV